jgi:hypothetical protein
MIWFQLLKLYSIEWDKKIIMNGKQIKTQKEAAMDYLKVLP